jgi:mannose-1-phosphate guanylyltransferase
LENLSKEGVEKVILAVNYMGDALRREFGTSKYGMDIIYSYEKKPLGTGGPIKEAENILNKDNTPFFVLNGDIISSIKYSKLYKRHQSFGGKGTIVIHEVEDPTRFGVVEISRTNQILKFIEKPTKEEAHSNLVNAGVYVLDHSVLDLIPNGKKASIEREVFPVMAAKRQLYSYKYNGLWVDTGKPNDYFLANKLMLDRIAKKNPVIKEQYTLSPSAKIIPPVVIGEDVIIEEDTCIGPYASIGDNVTIGKGTRIENAIIFPKAWIECHTSINGAIIGEAAIIGRWVKVEHGCIVGDHAMINDNITLTENVQICPNKEVSNSVLKPSTIM